MRNSILSKTKRYDFERPVNGFGKVIEEHEIHNMIIIACDEIGHPMHLREKLSLTINDFAVCAFMASRPLKGIGGIAEVVYLYSKTLAILNRGYNSHIQCLSGGGNVSGTPEEDGLMGQWARGATEAGCTAHFVTMQDLVQREGLPLANGRAVCLKRLDGEDRLGERTDGLISPADLFIVFPGGTGTRTELYTLLTNYSINPEFARKKTIFVDPVQTNPVTGKVSRYLENDMKMLVENTQINGISEKSGKQINDNCLVYQPDENLSPEQICEELISLTLAIRQAAPKFAPHTGYGPLSAKLRNKHIVPFLGNSGSKVVKLLDNFNADWGWIDDLRCLKKPAQKAGYNAVNAPR